MQRRAKGKSFKMKKSAFRQNGDVHWNTGSINTSGSKIVDTGGNWVPIDSTEGKKIFTKYSSSDYDMKQTGAGSGKPGTGIINLPVEKIVNQI
mgnify:CR=1 FL=1